MLQVQNIYEHIIHMSTRYNDNTKEGFAGGSIILIRVDSGINSLVITATARLFLFKKNKLIL